MLPDFMRAPPLFTWDIYMSLIFLAYIDPGSGAMAFQVLISGCLATAFTLRKRVMALLRRVRSGLREPRP